MVDTNRDTQLQASYADEEHTLVVGLARVIGNHFRFKIYQYDGQNYFEIEQKQWDEQLPILFKPMGTPIPDFLKEYRKGKKYLLLGMALNSDSERIGFELIEADCRDLLALVQNRQAA